MRGKKGLSNVVSTLLIVLLVIVAIGIIWVVISGFIEEGAADISFSSLTIDLKIMSATLDGNDLNVVVRRNPGEGEVVGVNFILSSGDNSKVYEERRVLNVFDVFTFNIPNYLTEVPGAYEVSIAPIFNTEQGKEKLGQILDTEVFAEEGVGGDEGDEGDEGDGGAGDVNTCDSVWTAPLTCTGSGTECADNTECGEGEVCGEGTGIVCDGGVSCVPPTIDELPGECACDPNLLGYIPDGLGDCVPETKIDTGTVTGVWPTGVAMYVEDGFPTGAGEADYGGKYFWYEVDGGEANCIQIQNHEKITGPVSAHLKFFEPSGVDVGNNYEIWDTFDGCGAFGGP